MGVGMLNSDSRGGGVKFIKIGEVVQNSDASGVGELKVRLEGGTDKNDTTANLIPCLPLLPRHINIMPEVGEAVFVFQLEMTLGPETTQKSERFWFGPIVSQLPDLEKSEKVKGLSGFLRGIIHPNKNITEIPESHGAYPDKEDVALQGRGSGDLILKKEQSILRIGKFKSGNRLKFNKENLGYIQLKHGDDDLKKEFIDDIVTVYKYTPPEKKMTAQITSIMSNGVILPEGLTDDEYSTASSHQLLMTKKNLKTNSIDNSDSGSYSARTEALEASINALGGDGSTFEGVYALSGKWELFTKTKEILEHYAEGSQDSFKNGTVIYPNSTQKVQETKKVLKLTKSTSGVKSTIVNIVADKINLISHDGDHTFELTDPKDLITKDTQNDINTKAHPMVYGDTLVEFLELVRDYVKSHVHPYHGMVADEGIEKLSVLNYDLQTILNKNINSN
tara:strand:+ start:4167 stop:5513 length:1347 start_codon:yes stop_codon:yes gene_type:complete